MSNIAENVQEKLQKKRSKVGAAIAKIMLSSDADQPNADQNQDYLHEIIDSCFAILSSPDFDTKNAEPVGELIAEKLVPQSDVLGDVQNSLAHAVRQDLTCEEMLWLQPRLIKVLADIANGYCRGVKQRNLQEQEDLYATYADQLEKNRLEMNELRTSMDSFVSLRMREFMETNFKLEKEIREHKKVRAALADSERRYRTLAESAHDYIFIINESDKIVYVNKHASDLFKSIQGDIVGSDRSELFGFSSGDLQKKFLNKVFETAAPVHFQDWTTMKNGVKAYLDTRLVPIMEKGKVHAVLGISRDLTDQKLIEEKIVDREKKYHTLFDTIHNGIFLMKDEVIIDCNQSSTKILGLKKKQLIGRQFHTLFFQDGKDPESTKSFVATHIDRCQAGQYLYFELDYTRPDRKVLNCEIHFTRIQESDQWHVLAVIRNITQYKKATEAIKASESRFRDIIRRSLDGYFFIDVNYRITQLNRAGRNILTYSKEEVNERFLSKSDEEWNKKLQWVLKKAMGGKAFAWEEFYYIDKNGEPRWIAINVRRVYNDGIVSGVEGFIKDITRRKRTEIELIENEARYRALFENTSFDVFGLTLDRSFLKVNQNFQRNWGYFEGKTVQSFKPKVLALLVDELCDKVDARRETVEMNYKKKSKGTFKYFRIILAPIITEKKIMIGFVGLIIDTTDTVIALDEKKTFAEKLVQTSEEEQRRISRDIHDSLGQSLFALQLDISAARSNLTTDVERAKQILQNSEILLSTLMKEASNLCYRLSPRLLDDFGLVEALEDLVENIEMSGALDIEFEKKWEPHKKNKSIETALFRVFQEGLANVLKHAEASHVHLKLYKNDNGISLSIYDNGKGFDLQSVLNNRKKGFGLINMKERIEIIGGKFSLQTAPGKGTNIDIVVPSRVKG